MILNSMIIYVYCILVDSYMTLNHKANVLYKVPSILIGIQALMLKDDFEFTPVYYLYVFAFQFVIGYKCNVLLVPQHYTMHHYLLHWINRSCPSLISYKEFLISWLVLHITALISINSLDCSGSAWVRFGFDLNFSFYSPM